jgi:signal transduction histidine kinase
MSDGDLARRRADIRRGLLRVSTAGLVVVLVVVGLAVTAVVAAFRAQQHAGQAQEELRNSHLAQARAGRVSAVLGRKDEGLTAVTAAARVRPDFEARREAVAHFALLDLRDTGLRWTNPVSAQQVVFDPALERFALTTNGTALLVGRVSDLEIICRYEEPGMRIERLLGFSPDGRFVALACWGQRLLVFDVAAQRPAFWAKAPEQVRGLAFHPGEDLTAFIHADNSVRIARTGSGEEVARLQPGGQPFLLRFDSEGKRLAVTRGRRVLIYDWREGRAAEPLDLIATIFSMAWNGSVMAFGDGSGELFIYDERSLRRRRFVAHKDRVSDLHFTPDGRHLFSVSYDGSTRLWDMQTFQVVLSTTAGYARRVSADGQRVAYWNGSGWGCWQMQKPVGFRTLDANDDLNPFIWHVDFSPDGRLLTAAKDHCLRIVDVTTGETLLSHRENGLAPWAQFLADGQTVVTAQTNALCLQPFKLSTNGGVRGIELGAARKIELPGANGPGVGTISPDRQRVALPLNRNSLALVDLAEPHPIIRFDGARRVLRPALGLDKSWVASGSLHGSGTILWDATTGKRRRQLYDGNAHCFANADGSLLAVAGSDAYRFFDTRSWEIVKEISSERGSELPNFAAFSADGSLLAIVKEHSRVQLWDPRNWRLLTDLISSDPQMIYWLAFSPDRRRLAVATNRDRVELWDLETLRAGLGRMGLDWSDSPGALEANQGLPAVASGLFANRTALLLLTAAGGVGVVLLCAAFVLRRQRELIRAYLDVDRQMEQRTRQLEMAQAEILHGQKMKALGTLAAGIAHDFNNLLSIIRMANKLTAKQTQSDAEVQDNVRLVEKAVGQGKQLVNSMLGYSREPAGEQGPCSIADVVESAVNLLSKQFLSGLDVKIELDRNLPPVALAKGRLEQILLNLIVNVSEAMKGQGTLRLAVQEISAPPGGWVLPPAQASRYVQLLVADTGPGIAPDVLPRIFEPFFTTKNAGTTRGTGLGLSMVYTLAQHEGFGLRVESELGKGTTFRIVIPVREAAGERAEGLMK